MNQDKLLNPVLLYESSVKFHETLILNSDRTGAEVVVRGHVCSWASISIPPIDVCKSGSPPDSVSSTLPLHPDE